MSVSRWTPPQLSRTCHLRVHRQTERQIESSLLVHIAWAPGNICTFNINLHPCCSLHTKTHHPGRHFHSDQSKAMTNTPPPLPPSLTHPPTSLMIRICMCRVPPRQTPSAALPAALTGPQRPPACSVASCCLRLPPLAALCVYVFVSCPPGVSSSLCVCDWLFFLWSVVLSPLQLH